MRITNVRPTRDGTAAARHRWLMPAVALCMTACAAPAATATTTTPATSTAPPAAATRWTLADACTQYRTDRAPTVTANATLDRARRRFNAGSITWKAWQAAVPAVLASEQARVGSLQSPPQPWPAAIARHVPALVDGLLLNVGNDRALIRATTRADFLAAWDNDLGTAADTSAYVKAREGIQAACTTAGVTW